MRKYKKYIQVLFLGSAMILLSACGSKPADDGNTASDTSMATSGAVMDTTAAETNNEEIKATEAVPAATTAAPAETEMKTTEAKQETAAETSSNTYTYSSAKLGFTITLPNDWKEKLVINELDNAVIFACKACDDNHEGDGELFSVIYYADTKSEDLNLPSYEVLNETEAGVLVLTYPTDLTFDDEVEGLMEAYNAMYSQAKNVTSTIVLN